MAGQRENTDQLRSDIDHGRTGDKVAFRDPAAAPLGADDEAAGTPPSPEMVAEARKLEGTTSGLAHGLARGASEAVSVGPSDRSRIGRGFILVIAAMLGLVAVALALG